MRESAQISISVPEIPVEPVTVDRSDEKVNTFKKGWLMEGFRGIEFFADTTRDARRYRTCFTYRLPRRAQRSQQG